MKKALAILVALILVLSFAACGAQEAAQDDTRSALDDSNALSNSAPSTQATADSSDAAPVDGGAAMESLIDWMMGGTFSYDFTLYSEYEGTVSEGSGFVAMAGGNMAMTTEQTTDGVTSKARVLILDGATYIIDDASKLIMKMANAGPEITGGMATSYEDMTVVGSGTGEVNGKTLPYEEYLAEGVQVKYYMDGGMVYAIESTYEGAYSLMIISNASNTVPAGTFDLPEGYMEMEI